MPIGFVCHGMHGADNRKVISSDIYECTDALILSGFRQCEWDTNSVSPQLHPTLIVGSVNSNSKYIFQSFICCNTATDIYLLCRRYVALSHISATLKEVLFYLL